MSEYVWQKMNDKDKLKTENMLRDLEDTCVGVCDRFLNMVASRDQLWLLKNKKKEFKALIISSKSTLMPVLCGIKDVPPLKFLNSILGKKKIHSTQGLLEDVFVIEKEMNVLGRNKTESFDYELMALDCLPNNISVSPASLVLRVPSLNDIDALLPLRQGYEEEEVLPKGSKFNPEASRLALVNFVSKKRMLAAEADGRIVGKVLINAVSFTRYQIGGVYVLPTYRGRGIASRMVHEFVSSLINEGKGVTLFVKKNNIPARKIYNSLGFKYKSDYRITYY